MTPHRSEPEGLNVGALLEALRRSWLLILTSVLVTTGAAVAFALQQPVVYQTSSIVYIETEPDAAGAMGFAAGVQGRTLANEIQRLRLSSAVQEGVAHHVLEVPDTLLNETPEPVARLARALPGIVTVAPYGEGVDMIEFTARSADPEAAAAIANAYAQVYSERGQSASQSGVQETRSFLENQAEKQRTELREAEAALAAFKTRTGTMDLGQAGQHAVSQVASLDAAIQDAGVELQVSRSRRASLERELERVRPGLVNRVSSTASGEIDALQGRIANLEVQASEYYARDPSLRGDESRSPELARLNQRIEDARRQVRRLAEQHVAEVTEAGGADGSDGIGYVATLQRQLAEEAVAVQSLQARLNALLMRRRDYASRLRQIPTQQVQLAELERAKQAAEASYQMLAQRAGQVSIAEEGDLDYVEIVRPAPVPTAPVAAAGTQTVVLGLLLGLLLGVGVALVREVSDSRVRTREALRSRGFRVIGTVPDFASVIKETFAQERFVEVDGRTLSSLVVAALDPYSIVTEAFRYIRTALRFSQGADPARTLLVTSPGPAEGKSTVAMGLAVAFAQAGRRTLYVDADLRKPSGHRLAGIDRRGGLANALVGGGPPTWEAYRRPIRAAWRGTDYTVDGLYVLPAGDEVSHPTELLGGETLPVFLEEAREAFDIVIIDSSPVLPVPDALLVAAHCDATVLVANAGETGIEAVSLAYEALEGVAPEASHFAGVILNRAIDRGLAGYGYGYGYAEDPDKAPVPFRSSGDGAAVPHQAPVLEGLRSSERSGDGGA